MEETEELSGLTKILLTSQRFAVLATLSEGQPYSNLVAFAETDNLRSLLFVTSRKTHKYSNTLASKKVALLIDSRTNQTSDFSIAIAITALGTIDEVAAENKDYLSEIYLYKHLELKDFLSNPSSALMKIVVNNYIVATFDSVRRLLIGET
ncbi:pyridoxamine 5'-phosphate oxidase family protein [Chloroflexota bacterium]